MLKASSVNCRRCPALCNKRKSIVDGAGDHSAPLMVVDAWPGREEDKAGMPQLGEGGRLLRATVTEACNRLGVDPLRVFYTYAARCKPSYGHDVTDDELESCLPWLVGEIDEILPVCILALGSVAQGQVDKAVYEVLGDQARDNWIKRAYSPNYILKNKGKLANWQEQIEIAVRKAFGIPEAAVVQQSGEPWEIGMPDMTSRWLSADTEFDTLEEEYGTTPVGFSMSDGIVSNFWKGDPRAGPTEDDPNMPMWPHLYLHNIKADADHLGIDLHDLDSWDDTMLMAYCTRRFSRVGLKVLAPLLAGVEW